MTTTIAGERGQLTALRGAWLFDGTGPTLIPDPVVVIEGSVIRVVCSGGRVPENQDGGTVIDLPGATLGMVPVPGMTPPPAVAMRMPAMMANMRRLYESGAVMVAGTDAGIAPVKPHDVVRHAPPVLRQLGFSGIRGKITPLMPQGKSARTAAARSRPLSVRGGLHGSRLRRLLCGLRYGDVYCGDRPGNPHPCRQPPEHESNCCAVGYECSDECRA